VLDQTATQEVPGSRLLRRSFRKTFPPAVRGEGAYLWDSQGKQYLDFSGSAGVNFIGHGVGEIVSAMTEQARSLEFADPSRFTTAIADEYAEELLAFAGEGFFGGAVYFSSGGSEAVETALKLARQYQVEIGNSERFAVISRSQSYHGATVGTMAVSGNKQRREMYRPMLREFATVNAPYCYRCAHDSNDDCSNCAKEYAAEVERAIVLSCDKAGAVVL